MDPISLTTGVLALIGTCVTVSTAIKSFIERTKSTKALLLQLLNRVEHVRIHLANLRSLSGRLVGPHARGVLIPFDQGSCEATLRKLESLVQKIVDDGKAGKLKVALAWMQEKSVAQDLVEELSAHERSIMTAMSAVAALSSVVTKDAVDRMIETTEKLTLDQNPFTAKEDATYDAVPILPTYQAQKPDREMQLWLGQVTKDELHRDYRIARDELADAAYMGRWDIVFDILEEGAGRFQEQWVNGARMKPSSQVRQMSLWTPLHQAAFLGASVDVIQQMLELGAFRTLRTAWTNEHEGLTYRDETAAEIARDMGYLELYALLCPIIWHPLPSRVVGNLQEQLHTLLKSLINDGRLSSMLRLPEVSVLTELETPLLRFPIHQQEKLQWTFQILLDGRELVLRALRYFGNTVDEEYFRVTEKSSYAIEEPIVSLA